MGVVETVCTIGADGKQGIVAFRGDWTQVMCRWLYVVLAVNGLLWRAAPASGAPPFEIVTHSVDVDVAQRRTRFSLTFNQRPDFFTVDEFDRPANAFQYWYDARPGGFEFAGEDVVVIRGSEIRFSGALPVRASLNPSGEEFPHAEGWGEERGQVPVEMNEATLQFTVPWKLLGEDDTRFSYRLLALEYGEQTSDIEAVFVPLPTPLKMGAVALGAVMVALGMKRRWVP
jgi:hypothetical protein